MGPRSEQAAPAQDAAYSQFQQRRRQDALAKQQSARAQSMAAAKQGRGRVPDGSQMMTESAAPFTELASGVSVDASMAMATFDATAATATAAPAAGHGGHANRRRRGGGRGQTNQQQASSSGRSEESAGPWGPQGQSATAVFRFSAGDASHMQQQQREEGYFEEGDGGLDGQARRNFYARQLMSPEWMTDVPPDLASSWYVMPRPQGTRCLLISSRGITMSRLRNGSVVHRFRSALPDGGLGGSCGGGTAGGTDSCVLDCVYHEPDHTFYVQDLLCWRGHNLQDCTAEFRQYWLAAKQAEEPDALVPADAGGGGGTDLEMDAACTTSGAGAPFDEAMPAEAPPFRIRLLPCVPCELAGLQAAYQAPVPFVRDGLYFLHKEGLYACGESSPLALLWKDAGCSTYLLDTDAAGRALEHQMVTLEYLSDQRVVTGDVPPIALGRMPDAFVTQMGDKLRAGRLLRFTVQEGGLQFHIGRPVGGDLKYVGPSNQRRGRPDLFSKIMFQYCARRQPLVLQHLVQAVTASQDTVAATAVAAIAAAAAENAAADVCM